MSTEQQTLISTSQPAAAELSSEELDQVIGGSAVGNAANTVFSAGKTLVGLVNTALTTLFSPQ